MDKAILSGTSMVAVAGSDSAPLPLALMARTSNSNVVNALFTALSPFTVKEVAFAPPAALLAIVVQFPKEPLFLL